MFSFFTVHLTTNIIKMHPVCNRYNLKQHSCRKDLVAPRTLPYCKRRQIATLLELNIKDVTIMQYVGVSRTCYYKYKPFCYFNTLYLPNDIIYRETGCTTINARTKIINAGGVLHSFLIHGLISDPSATVKKVQLDLSTRYGIFISFSTINRWRHDYNLTYKKLTKQPKEANLNQCIHHIEILRELVTNVNQLAYFDESHSNQKLHNPTHGWSLK